MRRAGQVVAAVLASAIAVVGCTPSRYAAQPNEPVEYRAGVRVPRALPRPPGPPVAMPRVPRGFPASYGQKKRDGVFAFIDHEGRWHINSVRTRLGSAQERHLHIQGVSGPLAGIGPVHGISHVWGYAIVHQPNGITWHTGIGPGEAVYRLEFRAPGSGCIRLHVLDHQDQPTIRIYVGPNEALAPSPFVTLCG